MAKPEWQHAGMPMPDDEIRAIISDYEAETERTMQKRDERLRAARDSGRRQAELVRVTGMSREAIRQALNPEVREAIRKARATRSGG